MVSYYYPLRQIQKEVRIAASSEISKAVPAFLKKREMAKKYRNLYHLIHERNRLWEAYRKASRGKKDSAGYLFFREFEAANIEQIIRELEDGNYAPEEPTAFFVYEPKARKISALPFLDRIIQHSIFSVLSPLFEKTFLPYSFACREGKGTHAGARYVQSIIRKNENLWYLKVDFKGYFYNIDRERLWREIDKKISCDKTKDLLEKFHPRVGKGIPIGNLTSQMLANIYGHIFDRFLTHDLKIKQWARYMDDTIIFGDSKEELQEVFQKISVFASDEMKLEWSKWSVRPCSKGINFLGYRIWANYKLIRPDSVRRAKRKLGHYRKHNLEDKLERFTASWLGHIKWANCNNLAEKLIGA